MPFKLLIVKSGAKMKKLSIILLTFCTSCSVTFIYAPKTVNNKGNDNKTEIQGSDLKDNKASQDSSLKIPLAFP